MTKKERRLLRQKTIEEKGAKEFAEIKAKVKEQKRRSIEKHNMVADAMHIYITCEERVKSNVKLNCKPWDCPKCKLKKGSA